MSRHAYELCTLLVDDTYGELTSRIFEVLLCYGRLSLAALQRYAELSSRLAKHGLSVLIQQHLVLWYTSPDDHITLYEANTAVAYSLVRSGKYIQIAEAHAGQYAGKVISNLLLLGHARVGDLVQAYGVGSSKGTHAHSAVIHGKPGETFSTSFNRTEDRIEGKNTTLESIHGTLCDLLQAELVSRVHISHFRSDADNRSEAEKVVPPPGEYKAKSKRERDAQHEIAVKRKLKEWKYCVNGGEDDFEDFMKGKKRPRQDPESRRPEKRQRLDSPLSQDGIGTTENAYQPMLGENSYLDSNLVLRVNHAKFAILMRNDHLVNLADRTIGTSTAKVYAQVLRALEPEVRVCQEEPEDLNERSVETDLSSLPQVSTDELVEGINDSSELANALSKADDGRLDTAQLDHPKKRRKKERISENGWMHDGEASQDEEDDSSDSDEEENISDVSSDPDEVNGEAEFDPNALSSSLPDDPHRNTIRNHLLVLATHPFSFLQRIPKTSILPERWTVDFPTLMKSVSHHTLIETITSRHGVLAARLTGILYDRGKTDEKVLCSTSLVAQKTMRSYLLPLHKAGMIGLQEVPRDNSRNPQRTNFLWFFDPERCKAKILEEAYKVMARYLRRAKVEAENVKSTVEKADRSDVVGREEEFLSVQELEALKVWRKFDERIWGQVSRLDDLIACLRDY